MAMTPWEEAEARFQAEHEYRIRKENEGLAGLVTIFFKLMPFMIGAALLFSLCAF